MDKILHYLTLSEYLATIRITNPEGYSAIHYAAHNPESLKMILGMPYIPTASHVNAIKIHGVTGRLVLHCAVLNAENLKTVLDLYPKEERIEAMFSQDKEGNTAFHHARKHPESFKILLDALPREQWPRLLRMTNNAGETVLHHLYNNPCLQTLLAFTPQEERFAIVQQKNRLGHSVLSTIAHDYETLYPLFLSVPKNRRLSALKLIKNDTDRISFHILKLIPYLPPEDRLQALGLRHIAGHTIISYAVSSSIHLQKTLALLPEEDVFSALKLYGQSGVMLLHSAAKYPHLLKVILSFLSTDESFNALTLRSKSGQTILHYVANTPDLFKKCFNALSDPDKLKALTVTNIAGKTLIKSIHHPDSLKLVTELLSRYGLTKEEFLKRVDEPKRSTFSSLFGTFTLFGNAFATQRAFRGGDHRVRPII